MPFSQAEDDRPRPAKVRDQPAPAVIVAGALHQRRSERLEAESIKKPDEQPGDDDMSGGSVSFRFRDGSQENGIPFDEAIAKIAKVVEERTQV